MRAAARAAAVQNEVLMIYGTDVAFIHDAGYSEFAESASMGVIEILWRHGIRDGLVVDAGCGSGVLSRELARAGFAVLGFDASPAMIELARENAPGARFEVARLGDVTLPPCKAVVAIGEVFNYATLDEIRTFVTGLRSRLLLFDVVECPLDGEHRSGGEDWSVIVSTQGSTRRILTFREIDGDVRRSDEVHELTLHGREAMVALLHDNGFRVRLRLSYGSRRLPEGRAVYECASDFR